VLFFISLESRRIEFVACTPNPTGAWVAQQARNLVMTLDDREQRVRFLIHDRDSKFNGGFDHVFTSEGVTVIRTPIQAPNANRHAERWVGSVRRECLDRLLIFSRRQLEHVLRVYVRHYNQHRPHRALALRPPRADRRTPQPLRGPPYPQLNRRDLLGGLIHEYEHASRDSISFRNHDLTRPSALPRTLRHCHVIEVHARARARIRSTTSTSTPRPFRSSPDSFGESNARVSEPAQPQSLG
jgi:putative transposase